MCLIEVLYCMLNTTSAFNVMYNVYGALVYFAAHIESAVLISTLRGMFCCCTDKYYITSLCSNCRPSEVPGIRRLFPNSVFTEIPKSGHWPHYEKPREFLAELIKFLT